MNHIIIVHTGETPSGWQEYRWHQCKTKREMDELVQSIDPTGIHAKVVKAPFDSKTGVNGVSKFGETRLTKKKRVK